MQKRIPTSSVSKEIGSPAALTRIVERLPRGPEYTTQIIAPADKRGIANALVARLPVLAQWVHTADDLPLPVFVVGDAAPFPGRIPLRRPMPHARFAVGGLGAVDVLVAHWKSQHGTPLRRLDGSDIPPANTAEWVQADVRALMARAAEALFVRDLIERTQKDNPRVALVGDLNDTFESVPVRLVRAVDAGLYGVAGVVPAPLRFSATHAGQRTQIDHILISNALKSALVSAEFFNTQLRDHGALGETTGPTPDSDHALFVSRFRTS